MARNEKWNQLSNVFVEWLNSPLDTELPESVLPYLNHKLLVSMFSKEPKVNTILNKLLNNKNLYSIDIKELALYLKLVMKNNNISDNKIWWFSNLEYSESQNKKFIYTLLNEKEKDTLQKMIDNGYVDEMYSPYTIKRNKETKKKKIQKSELNTLSTTISLETIRNTYINLKQTNLDCKKCTLYNSPIVTFDSNLDRFNPKDIDIMFIAEAPGQTEVEQQVPLIGKSGQIIRDYISKYFNNMNWFMTNVCLCRPENNRTPTKHEISCCYIKLDEIIDIVKPKFIVALGSTAMERLGIQGPITRSRGVYKYRGYDVYLTLHPSALLRSHQYNIYDEDFSNLRDILYSNMNYNSTITTETMIDDTITKNLTYTKNSDNYTIKFPDKYYKSSLLDIQRIPGGNVLCIFRDSNGKKEYYKVKPNFYYFVKEGKGTHTEFLDNLVYLTGKPNYNANTSIQNNETLYESDIPIDIRYSVDYYLNKPEDNIIIPKVMYIDIEVLSDGSFPDPKDASWEVVLVTFKIDDNDAFTYVLGEGESNNNITYFNNEKDLLTSVAKVISSSDYDILTAWNVFFDIPYIYQRMINLGIDTRLLSPVSLEPDIDMERLEISIPGIVVTDLLEGYKHLVENKKESYSLDFIASEELGEGKSHKGSAFNILWNDNKEESIKYNIRDVELIYEIDKKLDIIGYLNELRNVSCIPWKCINYTSKIVEGLLLKFMREKGLCVRSKINESKSFSEQKYGAYVYNPIPGLHEYVYEVDFSKQYPSTIQSLNIGTNTFFAVLKDRSDIRDILRKDKSKVYKVIINPIYNPEIVEMTYNQIKDFIKQNNLILSIAGGFFLSHKVEKSNLYDLIDYLNASRNKYKKLYAETLNKVYDNKQRAFKIVTNSVYGYLGLETSRMYNVYLVNNITLTSRYINKLCALSINKLLEDKIDSFDEDTFRNVILKEFLDKYIEYDMDKPFTLYGDTDSIFVKIADKSYSDWKEAKERGDKILQFIDKVVVKKYIANVMNLDPDEARWKLGYQGIGKVFLLPVKKKYIFYFYEKEDGTSGLDYRGIELRRSDFPRLTKEYMQQLIDMLLVNPKPMNELRQFATNVEREFITRINNFDPLVARSSSFTKKLDDYKKVPAYVVAMIFWNRAFSKVFVPGSKGYSYRVKFVNPPSDILNIIKQVEKEYNLSELSWITIPEGYTEKLPSWIKVDTNYMLNFAWKDRIKDLIPEEKETLFTFDDF